VDHVQLPVLGSGHQKVEHVQLCALGPASSAVISLSSPSLPQKSVLRGLAAPLRAGRFRKLDNAYELEQFEKTGRLAAADSDLLAGYTA
jgi:hypothetical protein